MIVYISDVRRVFCVSGCRTWFKQNNLDWRKFLRDGIEHSELEKLNDDLANKVLESTWAERRKQP